MIDVSMVFWKNKYLLFTLISALALNLISWLLVFFRFSGKNINVILYYNILFGVEYRGDAHELFTIPFVGLLIFSLNFAIIKFIYRKENFIFCLLLAASFFSQILILVAIISLLLINNKGVY